MPYLSLVWVPYSFCLTLPSLPLSSLSLIKCFWTISVWTHAKSTCCSFFWPGIISWKELTLFYWDLSFYRDKIMDVTQFCMACLRHYYLTIHNPLRSLFLCTLKCIFSFFSLYSTFMFVTWSSTLPLYSITFLCILWLSIFELSKHILKFISLLLKYLKWHD